MKNAKKVKAQIWDTCKLFKITLDIAGCERYRAITTGHYRRAEGALLVYDIINRESFKNASTWLKELREHAGDDTVVALVGNKVDVLFADPEKREVSKEQAMLFAKEHNLIFAGESSALADVNIKETIELLTQSTIPILLSCLEVYDVQTNLVKLGKRDPKSLKLTYEEESHRNQGGCC